MKDALTGKHAKLVGHTAGPKTSKTDAKRLKVSKKAYTLKVGQSTKLKVKTVKLKKRKALLHKGKIRYVSSNPDVAKVSAKGKITAVSAGTCEVWAYAQNGRSVTVTVIVQ